MMAKFFTRTSPAALLALGLLLAGTAHAAPVPVAVTGYTADVVADGTGTVASSTSTDFDAASYALMALGYTNPGGTVATTGLPATGLINSAATPGLTFQLASYTANNSLQIQAPGTGILTLVTPRAAGDVFVLASSGSLTSTVGMTVTFTDGSTQAFPATVVPDWFGGSPAAISGIGRVSRADNTIQQGTSGNPRLYQFKLTIAPGNLVKLVQSVAFDKTSTSGVLNVMGISINPVCSGLPTAGTTAATATNTCAGTVVLSLTGASTDGGITYQWQASTNGGTSYSDITGATGATYTVAGQSVTTLYRARVTCPISAQSADSAPITISSTAPTYAPLPVVESFENTWINVCSTRDVPTTSWRNAPATGNNSWRREDDGAGAAWVNAGSYSYTPSASQGSHSARFHSGQAQAGQIGILDLYADLSAAGPKRLTFSFINTTSTGVLDSLYVQLSTNGGATFTRLIGLGASGAGFNTQVLPINSTSATSVIRFRAKADFGTTDIGLDNIVLEAATGCLTPAVLTATAVTPTTASLSWLTGGTGTYTVIYGLTGFNPATGGTSVSGLTGPPYNVTGLLPGTTYQFYVVQNCAGGNSGQAGPVSFTTQILNDDPCGATVLTINPTCTPTATTLAGATTTGNMFYAGGNPGTGCGTNPFPRDVWFTFTTAATGPISTAVRLSVSGGPASVVRVYSGTACSGPLTYVACAGTASNTAAPSLDLTTLTPSTTYYVRVSNYAATSTLGNFTICAAPVPNCPNPSGPAANNVTATSAQLTWGGTPPAGGTYTVIYGPVGFSPTSGGTQVTGITGVGTSLNTLTANTNYEFYVQLICGGFNGNSTLIGPVAFSTPIAVPGNDEPCGAITMTTARVGGTTIGATTSGQNGIDLPACSPAQSPKDVWFGFDAGSTSSVFTIQAPAAGMIRVYESPDCAAGPFNLVFCQASSGSNAGFSGPVTVSPLVAGRHYYVAISGYGSADNPGPFAVTATLLGTHAASNGNAVVVYPNPSSTGSLTLRLDASTGRGQATLLNTLGQQVLTQALTAGTVEHSLSTRGLAAGVYTLRVVVGTEVFTQKVVLE